MRLHPLALATTCALLAGCALGPPGDKSPTLAQLPEATTPDDGAEVGRVELAAIEQRYRDALAVATDPDVRHHILVRLADLEMARSEQAQQEATTLERFFTRPIEHYRELISAYEADPEDSVAVEPDALYYKLAKAYALDGRDADASTTLDELARRFPDSPYLDEAQFRRAERAFSDGRYARAEQLYRQVAQTRGSSFADNALYMQGWAAYKQSRYRDALTSFTALLDRQLGELHQPRAVDRAQREMSPNQRNLLDDTLRIMGYSYANLDGPHTIAEQQSDIGTRAYQHLLYQSLGELYLEQQRYLDSADTYARFVINNPDSDLAPDFSLREIQVYRAGGYPSMVLPAKRAYVERYGIYSSYWQARAGIAPPASALQAKQIVRTDWPGNMSAEALGKLRQYLEELARHDHATAQRLQTARAEGAEDVPEAARVRAAYADAADGYQQFLLTFPDSTKADELMFLMAEALEAGGRTLAALETYETLAFTREQSQHGADAGYSAVLLADELAERHEGGEELPLSTQDDAPDSQLWQWQMRKIDNALAFAERYPGDDRAVGVLARAAPELMYQGEVARAADVARQVITWQPAPEGAQLYSAWLTLGHAEFEQEHYPDAESAYWQALSLHAAHGDESPTEADIRQRIAASIYQQAQTQLAANEQNAAIETLLRIPEELPDTDIARKALFDAGHTAQMSQQWGRAERLLKRFAAAYPDHNLNERLPAKFLAIYEATEQWDPAAALLSQREAEAKARGDTELARQALLNAAEYYDRADNWEGARDHYRRYAHNYPEPADELIEAQHRLTELYRERGDTASRNYWLEKIIQTARRAPTERSRYLGAQSAATLAEGPFRRFAEMPIRAPIDQSLPAKRDALQDAIDAQQRVLDFKVAQFTTQANYHIAELYTRLAADLMDSERPEGLSALELSQYNVLLEEQVYPFEDKAIELHRANARRSWQGTYDDWVAESFNSLAELLPARYNKHEQLPEVADEIR